MGSIAGSGITGTVIVFIVKQSLAKLTSNESRIIELEKLSAVEKEKLYTLKKSVNSAHEKIRELEKYDR